MEVAKTYANAMVVSETEVICLNTSKPSVAMITGATFKPAPITITAWNIRSQNAANNAPYQGTTKSSVRPKKGPTMTPSIPRRPNNPISNL